jgi:hypothetical protein
MRLEAIDCLREAVHFTKRRYEDKLAKYTTFRFDHDR